MQLVLCYSGPLWKNNIRNKNDGKTDQTVSMAEKICSPPKKNLDMKIKWVIVVYFNSWARVRHSNNSNNKSHNKSGLHNCRYAVVFCFCLVVLRLSVVVVLLVISLAYRLLLFWHIWTLITIGWLINGKKKRRVFRIFDFPPPTMTTNPHFF